MERVNMDVDKQTRMAIDYAVKVALETGNFIRKVKEGDFELTKERLMEELSKIMKAKELIQKCEHRAVALPLERQDLDNIEKQLWGIVIERL